MVDYTGKTVWITGASAGIGAALARAFAARGARLVLSARRAERLQALARDCGARDVQVLPLDLADFAALPGCVEQVLARFGAVDVMVHNAGVGQRSLVVETDFAVQKQLLDVNYLGPVALTQALLPSMLARGRAQLVVISSVLGLMSAPRRAGYCAAKHALHGYFNALRAELARSGVSVLLVCPGRVRSEFSESALEGDGRAHGVLDDTSAAGLSPEYTAQRTLAALAHGAQEVYVAQWESLAVYLNRLAPSLMRSAIARTRQR